MLPQEIGSSVELDKVLMVADGDKIVTGQPIIKGAKVNATVLEQGKGKKIIVLKYKNKTRYSKKTGHRQLYTKLSIDKIVTAKK
jgi:large subunit ribosomal protein L21